MASLSTPRSHDQLDLLPPVASAVVIPTTSLDEDCEIIFFLVQTQKDSTLYGRASIKYRGGTARKNVSWLNVMAPGDAVLVGSITSIKVSMSLILVGYAGPVASTSIVYR